MMWKIGYNGKPVPSGDGAITTLIVAIVAAIIIPGVCGFIWVGSNYGPSGVAVLSAILGWLIIGWATFLYVRTKREWKLSQVRKEINGSLGR
jgi:hypothetical protein